jgi:hypothetical protein
MNNIKIIQGIHEGNKHGVEWKLFEGSGSRATEYTVPFNFTFKEPPAVQFSIIGMDVMKEGNTRFNIEILEIKKDSFKIRYKTWNDTQIWFIKISWMAIGQE